MAINFDLFPQNPRNNDRYVVDNTTWKYAGDEWIEVLAFPADPSVDDIYQFKDKIWRWDGRKWKASAEAAPQTFTAAATFESDIVIDGTKAEKPGIQVATSEDGLEKVALYWNDSSGEWVVEDNDPDYPNKKIVIENDTLSGGNY